MKECYILILELVESNTFQELIIQKKNFKIQNNSINIGNYSIPPLAVPEELYRIFSNILYEQCFVDKDCWAYVEAGFEYNRVDFHKNFKTENNNRTICSLCDIETIIAKSSSIVEHFLPRNLFPYLSVNANNLTSCCNACNLGEEGKGTRAFSPMASPFRIQIGENLNFNIQPAKIVVSSKETNVGISNYVNMMKLNKRFSTDSVFTTSVNRLNAEISLHNRLKAKIHDNDELLEFFTEELENRKYDGFYFLKKHYFGDNYKEYLDEIVI